MHIKRENTGKNFTIFLYSEFPRVNTSHHTRPLRGIIRIGHKAEGIGEQWASAFNVFLSTGRNEAW